MREFLSNHAWPIRRAIGVLVGLLLVDLLVVLLLVASTGDTRTVPVVVWVLLLPAYARATQLAVNDRLTEPARRAFAQWAGYKPDGQTLTALAYLAGCAWCLSIYTAAVLSAVVLAAPSAVAAFLLLTLAGSELAVLFDRLVDRYAPDPESSDGDLHGARPPATVSAIFEPVSQREDRL